jgi:hypothetical protein
MQPRLSLRIPEHGYIHQLLLFASSSLHRAQFDVTGVRIS